MISKNLILITIAIAVVGVFYYKRRSKTAAKQQHVPRASQQTQNTGTTGSTGNGKEIILYYAPWCGYCKKFMPTFMEFAEEAKTTYPDVNIKMVNCVADKENCISNIKGYPTLVASNSATGASTQYMGLQPKERLFQIAKDL